MPAADTANNLGKELEGFFFRGEVGNREAGVSLDYADGGEMGKVKASGNSLSADDDFDFARFDFIVKRVQRFTFFVVCVEASDFNFGEEFFKFSFKEFSSKAFMKDAGVVAVGTGSRDFFLVAASVAKEGIRIGMEGEWQETVRAERLPAAFFTDGHGGGATAIVID